MQVEVITTPVNAWLAAMASDLDLSVTSLRHLSVAGSSGETAMLQPHFLCHHMDYSAIKAIQLKRHQQLREWALDIAMNSSRVCRTQASKYQRSLLVLDSKGQNIPKLRDQHPNIPALGKPISQYPNTQPHPWPWANYKPLSPYAFSVQSINQVPFSVHITKVEQESVLLDLDL